LIFKILTLMAPFSMTLITTDDPCFSNHVDSLLSFVAVSEDPSRPSNRMETYIRVNTILNAHVPSKSTAFQITLCSLNQVSRNTGGSTLSGKASTTNEKGYWREQRGAASK
jgi:hypothetical protein